MRHGNAPQRTLAAVAEMGDLDALGAIGRCDAAQLIRQALRRARPGTAVRHVLGIEQVVELAGGPLPIPRCDAIFEILVEHLGDGVAFQGTVDACAHQLGVLALEVTGLETKGAGHGLAEALEVGHALLVGQLHRRQDCQRRREQIEQCAEHLRAIPFPRGGGIGVIPARLGQNRRHIRVDDPVDEVGASGDHGDAIQYHWALSLHDVFFAVGVQLARGKSAAGGQRAKGILLLSGQARKVLVTDQPVVCGGNEDVFHRLGTTAQHHLVGINEAAQHGLRGGLG